MMVGTVMFALVTSMLSSIAPEPVDVNPRQLLELDAIVFQVIWWGLFLAALINLRYVNSRGLRDTSKILSWAMCVTGIGLVTDNWGRVMGVVEDDLTYYILAALIIVPGGAICYMNVRAMAGRVMGVVEDDLTYYILAAPMTL